MPFAPQMVPQQHRWRNGQITGECIRSIQKGGRFIFGRFSLTLLKRKYINDPFEINRLRSAYLLKNTFQWIFLSKFNITIQQNAFDTTVSKISTILFRPHCVDILNLNFFSHCYTGRLYCSLGKCVQYIKFNVTTFIFYVRGIHVYFKIGNISYLRNGSKQLVFFSNVSVSPTPLSLSIFPLPLFLLMINWYSDIKIHIW